MRLVPLADKAMGITTHSELCLLRDSVTNRALVSADTIHSIPMPPDIDFKELRTGTGCSRFAKLIGNRRIPRRTDKLLLQYVKLEI
jgi:hypothetical protein